MTNVDEVAQILKRIEGYVAFGFNEVKSLLIQILQQLQGMAGEPKITITQNHPPNWNDIKENALDNLQNFLELKDKIKDLPKAPITDIQELLKDKDVKDRIESLSK